MAQPVIKIKQGQLKGCLRTDIDGGKIYSFLGIPYAQPPIGELRFKLDGATHFKAKSRHHPFLFSYQRIPEYSHYFKAIPLLQYSIDHRIQTNNKGVGTDLFGRGASYNYNRTSLKVPVPAEPWNGVRDATKEGDSCYSRELMTAVLGGSEDCLNLNIFTKSLPESNRDLKPVMVWIHGGGFTSGSNRTALYGPDFLLTEDIVLVSINYRLGALGLLSLKDTSLGVPNNVSLEDQVLALKWVQGNIENFNGDPNNVTIFGQSAGSRSVHYHVLSNSSKGLFHRAILQSGAALSSYTLAQFDAIDLVKQLGREVSDEREALQILRDTPVEELFEAQVKLQLEMSSLKPSGKAYFGMDKAFPAKSAIDIYRSGEYNHVPIMIGYTSREMLFMEIRVALEAMGFVQKENNTPSIEDVIPWQINLERGSDTSKLICQKLTNLYFKGPDAAEVFINYPWICPRKLNLEVKAKVNENALKRNSKLEVIHSQLGVSLGAVGKAMFILLHKVNAEEKTSDLSTIKAPKNAERLLADLQYENYESRRGLVCVALKRNLKDTLTCTTVDGWLFGENLGERNKAAKAIEEVGKKKILRPKLGTDSMVAAILASIKYHLTTSQEPIYLYRMSLDAGLNIAKNFGKLNDHPGACHCDDLGYLFKTDMTPEFKPGSLEDRSVRRFVKLWTNFAKYGNPTPNKEELGIIWEPVKDGAINFLDIGEELTLDVDPEAERIALWKEIYQLNPDTKDFL